MRSTNEVTGQPLIGYVIRGRDGKHPGTAHVRVLGRVALATRRGTSHWTQVDPVGYVAGSDFREYAAILIQRDSLPAEVAGDFCERARVAGTRLVVELDDDLVSPQARARLANQGYELDRLDAFQTIVRRADHVIVSTATLRELVAPLAAVISVEPNMLNPQIWTWSRPNAIRRVIRAGSTPRLLYMGTTTHSEDLSIVREAITHLRSEQDPVVVEVDVIGVTKEDEDWFNRIQIPKGHHDYPLFAAWLQSQRHRWVGGLAPLVASPFNDAKSDLKFLEYTALGLATVASRTGPYADLAERGALTVGNSPSEWSTALAGLVTDSSARRALVKQSRGYVHSHRVLGTPEDNLDRWLAAVLGNA